MKKIFFSTLLLGFLLSSCDKVKNPIVVKDTAVGTNFITNSNWARANYKKVLLEDYTGHQCGNCPAAALVAENLANQYKDSLVVIAVHAGFFTKLTSPEFVVSYTTQAGNDWDASGGFGVSAAGNPNGMVNRKNFPGNGLIQKETKWPTTVPMALKDPFIVKLNVTTNYDPTAYALNTDIKATFLTNYTNGIKVSVVLIEDSIEGVQKDYTKNPDVVHGYEFMHVLRGGINGSWGDVLKAGPIAALDSAKISYPNFSVKQTYNDKRLYAVVFAYDAVSREVLQVEKVKIR